MHVSENVLAHRRVQLNSLQVTDPRCLHLIDMLTQKSPAKRWTVTHALTHSSIFESALSEGDIAATLLDKIELHKRPEGSCKDQLQAPKLVKEYPQLLNIVSDVETTVQRLLANASAVPTVLDPDSYVVLMLCRSGGCMPLFRCLDL